MHQIVLVDNSGYDAEILLALPHQYDDQATAETDRDTLVVHHPSTRYAAWEVWPVRRVADPAGWLTGADVALPAEVAGRLPYRRRTGSPSCSGCGRSGGELTENGCPSCGPATFVRQP